MSTPLENLDQLTLITLDVHIWSGRKKLRKSDLKVHENDLPPEALATLGSKRICDPEPIKKLDTAKKSAQRACEKAGIRFMGGYAIPNHKMSDLAAELDAIGLKFNALRSDLVGSFSQLTLDWAAKFPEWKDVILKYVPDVKHVAQRTSFDWTPARVGSAQSDVAGVKMNKAAGGLAEQLFTEIAKAAAEVMDRSLIGRDKATHRLLSPIKTIRSKLDGLAFLDKRVMPLIHSIDHVLATLPRDGLIEGADLEKVRGLVFLLSDTDRMKRHGEGILNGSSVQDLLTDVAQPAEMVTVAAPEAPQQTLPAPTQGVDDILVPPAAQQPLPLSGIRPARILF